MSHPTRRAVFAALLVLAVAGAAALMASSLLGDPGWRMRLQLTAIGITLGCGTACGVLAWRWWSAHFTDDLHPRR
jgi:hypothetical protein